MTVNVKKPIRIKNNTKYFNPCTSKSRVTFSSPDSYQQRRIKIEGYETRLYWQFRYCEEHDGQTFFYTLTYNDEHLPKMYGLNCFDYEDLRDLLTGGFRKQLLRKYGTTFKYFIGAELGDGKGTRGMHNNPHYHILFFLEDAKNERFPYVKITPDEFRHLVRLYWQGFDEDTDGMQDYRTAKYGIAREGENVGKVTDFRAVSYCAKYVCKDAYLKRGESIVEKKVRFLTKKSYKRSMKSFEDFFDEWIVPNYNIPLNPKCTEWAYDNEELVKRFIPNFFDFEDELGIPHDTFGFKSSFTMQFILLNPSLWEKYYKFVRDKVDEKVHLALNEYRNRYCNKCRISHGVGDYALEHIGDDLNPTFQVPSKKGFKNRPISMYYYRKLYTKVIIDKVGSPIRVLNDLGIQYKLSKLDEQIKKKAEQARNNLGIILGDRNLFEKMRESDINTEVRYHFDNFLKRWTYLLEENNNDLENILQRYGEYKTVYEDRFFPFECDGHGVGSGFPDINITEDYARFLVPSIYSVRRSDLRLSALLESDTPNYMPYKEHPYFLRYIGIFNVFDMCADYFFVQGDDKAQREAEDIAATKRFHDREKVKEFYEKFGIFAA